MTRGSHTRAAPSFPGMQTVQYCTTLYTNGGEGGKRPEGRSHLWRFWNGPVRRCDSTVEAKAQPEGCLPLLQKGGFCHEA